MFRILTHLFLSLTSLSAADPDPCACPMPVVSSPLPFERHNPIEQRVQWNTIHGYCGEMSLISAGLNYGQYMSQYTVRAAGNKRGSQLTQVLLQTEPDGSELIAAQKFLLNTKEFDNGTADPKAFLTWIKGEVLSGNPVIIGVYMNQKLDEIKGQGDPTYDHIILVTGVGSNHSLDGASTYYDDDVLYFWDNGLWYLNGGASDVAAYTSSSFSTFSNSRKNANRQGGNLYSLPIPTQSVQNYGISVTGLNASSSLIPLSITAPICEDPSILEPVKKRQEPIRPASKPIELTIAIGASSEQVNVYKYDDFSKVPTESFNANAAQSVYSWLNQSPSSSIVDDNVMSSDTAIYRAVKASDP